MSKKTKKRKARLRRSKANHGKRPNMGRCTLLPVPPARRDDVVDLLHGVAVPDPYRWLEAGDSPDTVAWVAAENERTREALDARPDRLRWHERLVALMQLPTAGGCQVRGERLFVLERPTG